MSTDKRNLNSKDEQLLSEAEEAVKQAYVPYSEFPVGAAVRTGDGSVYRGSNVENASYGLSMCAERTAIFKAVSEGHHELEAIAVAGSGQEETAPCGACRQVMREFNANLTIIFSTGPNSVKKLQLKDLLPESFGPDSL